MYVEDPLLPLHLNEETDLMDLTVSKHGNQKLLCIVSLSALFVCCCCVEEAFRPPFAYPRRRNFGGQKNGAEARSAK